MRCAEPLVRRELRREAELGGGLAERGDHAAVERVANAAQLHGLARDAEPRVTLVERL